MSLPSEAAVDLGIRDICVPPEVTERFEIRHPSAPPPALVELVDQYVLSSYGFGFVQGDGDYRHYGDTSGTKMAVTISSNCQASSGLDVFKEYISSDEGARRLGEVALVGIEGALLPI